MGIHTEVFLQKFKTFVLILLISSSLSDRILLLHRGCCKNASNQSLDELPHALQTVVDTEANNFITTSKMFVFISHSCVIIFHQYNKQEQAALQQQAVAG